MNPNVDILSNKSYVQFANIVLKKLKFMSEFLMVLLKFMSEFLMVFLKFEAKG